MKTLIAAAVAFSVIGLATTQKNTNAKTKFEGLTVKLSSEPTEIYYAQKATVRGQEGHADGDLYSVEDMVQQIPQLGEAKLSGSDLLDLKLYVSKFGLKALKLCIENQAVTMKASGESNPREINEKSIESCRKKALEAL